MVFALLARFLLKQPALVQAIVLGLCAGLFVTALAQANQRDPAISSNVWLVLSWGSVAAVLFSAGFVAQRRRVRATNQAAPPNWLYGVYAIVWVFGILSAVYALFSQGGFKVAALAIVPIVLLAPTALTGIRLFCSRDS
jgi:hypothetical protein